MMPVTNQPTLSDDQAIQLSEIFRIMGEPNRLRIALACLDDPMCVTDIAQRVGLSSSLVSHHLGLMRATRFLIARRQGKQVFYVLRDDRVRCVIRDMVAHVSNEPRTETFEELLDER